MVFSWFIIVSFHPESIREPSYNLCRPSHRYESGPLPQWICFFSTVWLLKVCVAKSDLFGITVRRVLDAGYDVASCNLCAAIAQHSKIQLSSPLLQNVQTGDAPGYSVPNASSNWCCSMASYNVTWSLKFQLPATHDIPWPFQFFQHTRDG